MPILLRLLLSIRFLAFLFPPVAIAQMSDEVVESCISGKAGIIVQADPSCCEGISKITNDGIYLVGTASTNDASYVVNANQNDPLRLCLDFRNISAALGDKIDVAHVHIDLAWVPDLTAQAIVVGYENDKAYAYIQSRADDQKGHAGHAPLSSAPFPIVEAAFGHSPPTRLDEHSTADSVLYASTQFEPLFVKYCKHTCSSNT